MLLVRDGCHLCEEAVAIVAEVCSATGVAWVTVDVDSDPDLRAAYSDHVPVTLVDGVRHALWQVDATALRAALAANGSP